MSASAQVSPREPPRLPISMFHSDGSWSVCPAAISLSGVAVATASIAACGAIQWVIWLPNDTSRKMRAVAAGLAKLQPMPPKRHLTTTIAMNDPNTAIQKGSVTGTLKARMIPVTTALQSLIVTGFW